MEILERLRDLHNQATTERSHYYVAKTCELAMAEIVRVRAENAQLWEALNGGDHPSECQCNDCYSRQRVQELQKGDSDG